MKPPCLKIASNLTIKWPVSGVIIDVSLQEDLYTLHHRLFEAIKTSTNDSVSVYTY